MHTTIQTSVPLILMLICGLLVPTRASAESERSGPPESYFSYGKQGLQFEDVNGNYFLWFGVRLQTRWGSNVAVNDEIAGLPVMKSSDFGINRGRLKLGGHVISPALTVYSEYDMVDDRLLDLRATYQFVDWLSIRVGQWKSEFNRERIDSSGKQQFVERSVVTPWFTIDRQQAVMASGRVAAGTGADTSYWMGWLSGAGRGGDRSQADGLWLGRVQWNFTGQVLGFSQSALKRPPQPLGSLAVAFVSGKSGFTAFSGAGGGQLPGFESGEPDRYRLEQWMIETAYQHGGFSWQQELHWKQVEDRFSGQSTRFVGGYAQAGMFFSEVFESFPEPLELALRIAHVDPNRSLSGAMENEYTLGANWFFNGHRNKLTLDLARIKRRMAPQSDTTSRLRVQWDWSF